MRVRITVPRDAVKRAFGAVEGVIAKAAKAAVEETAGTMKAQARGQIISAGLGPRLANALRVDTYPRKGVASVDAAAMMYSKASYMDIFETGGTIEGDPLLWLPLSSTPKRIGKDRLTPARYRSQIGPLFRITRPGEAPLLAGQIAINRRGQGKAGKGKVTLSALRRGGNAGKGFRLVPLFVGVPAVTIKSRIAIRKIADQAAGRLPALFLKHLAGEK